MSNWVETIKRINWVETIKRILKSPVTYILILLLALGIILLSFGVRRGLVPIIIYCVGASVAIWRLVERSWKGLPVILCLFMIPGAVVHILLSQAAGNALLITGGSVGVLFFLNLFCRNGDVVLDEEGIDQAQVDVEGGYSLRYVADLPQRFGYQDLVSATNSFSQRLGGGGFGSVFLGVLSDGTQVAVKCLDQLGQGEREFLAEVKTIGSIHHVNLVRLVGFCAENSLRLLVYEYMSKGSLDKWIFNENRRKTELRWDVRKNILINIARGLAYLHEECKMRIAHFDVKPQNILLDDSFNAKLSDFGLARMIDRNQSHVMTQMRGTRGYMAPEWLTGKITEKADIYSFGIVMIETICGRKNFDNTQRNEDDIWLLSLTRKKAEEDKLIDIVDKCNEDMQQHTEQAVEIIRAAIWCLHHDPNKRPSMATIVKVLEGVITPERIVDYRFLTLDIEETAPIEMPSFSSNAQQASTLSGPR